MFPRLSVSLSPTTLFELMDHLRATGAGPDPADAVETAVRYWLAAVKAGRTGKGATPPRGYLWKSLFLPEGTWLRKLYGDESEYAVVEGDQLMYRGRSTTPNQFACDLAGSVRNAWRDLTIRMPGEKQWKRADLRRREIQQAATDSVNDNDNENENDNSSNTKYGYGYGNRNGSGSGANAGPTGKPSALNVLNAKSPASADAVHTDAPLAAALAALTALAAAMAAPTSPLAGAKPPSPQPRVTTPVAGWTEPERRKYRFRLEDVAFD